jgi:hypothetical protein
MGTTPGDLDIGAVASDSLGVLQRRWTDFLIASLPLVFLPDLVSFGLRYVGRGASLRLAGVAIGLFALLLSFAYEGAVFYAANQDLDGKPAKLEDLFRAGFRTCLPLLALSLLVAIPVDLGLILLVVPGVLLFLRWIMAGPAMIAEGLGVFGAMRRSVELTKGRRWSIFLAYLVIGLASALVEAAYVVLAGGLSGMGAMASMRVVTPYSLVMVTLINPGIGILLSTSATVFAMALYRQLRAGREGASVAAVAEVFA